MKIFRVRLDDDLDLRLRNVHSDLCLGIKELRGEIGDLRDRLDRVQGYLDVLREFFVGSGRSTAAQLPISS